MKRHLYWWQRDTTTDLTGYGPLPDHGHETCLHRSYQLTCRQYELLLRRSGGNCEICELPGYENVHGKLYIDHDHEWGRWAVRGLLCWGCNNALEYSATSTEAQRYLSTAWYLTALAERGLPLEKRPEPDRTVTLVDHKGHAWKWRDTGWWRPRASRHHHREDRTWSWLHHEFGPHNLTVVSQPTAVTHA